MRALVKLRRRFQPTQKIMDVCSYVQIFSIWEARTSVPVEALQVMWNFGQQGFSAVVSGHHVRLP